MRQENTKSSFFLQEEITRDYKSLTWTRNLLKNLHDWKSLRNLQLLLSVLESIQNNIKLMSCFLLQGKAGKGRSRQKHIQALSKTEEAREITTAFQRMRYPSEGLSHGWLLWVHTTVYTYTYFCIRLAISFNCVYLFYSAGKATACTRQ